MALRIEKPDECHKRLGTSAFYDRSTGDIALVDGSLSEVDMSRVLTHEVLHKAIQDSGALEKLPRVWREYSKWEERVIALMQSEQWREGADFVKQLMERIRTVPAKFGIELGRPVGVYKSIGNPGGLDYIELSPPRTKYIGIVLDSPQALFIVRAKNPQDYWFFNEDYTQNLSCPLPAVELVYEMKSRRKLWFDYRRWEERFARLQLDYERRWRRHGGFKVEPTPTMRKRILRLFREGLELLEEPWAKNTNIDWIMMQYLPDYYASCPSKWLEGEELERTIEEMKIRLEHCRRRRCDEVQAEDPADA